MKKKEKEKFTVKKRFAYLPILVWSVPCIKGRYYRWLFWENFYTIQKEGIWQLKHTYKEKFTAEVRAQNLNIGYIFIKGKFYEKFTK